MRQRATRMALPAWLSLALVLAGSGGSSRADVVPVAGDWGGDGVDTVGTFDPALGEWRLRHANFSGPAVAFRFGEAVAGAVPLVGDWDGDGDDTPGIFAPPQWLLRNSNSEGPADAAFDFDPLGLAPDALD